MPPARCPRTPDARRGGTRQASVNRPSPASSPPTSRSRTMSRPHVVVVGAGFAGHQAARRLTRLARGRARITIVNPTDYFLYAPLLPEVATGVLEPRRITVSLSGTLPGVRLVLGDVDGVDLARRVVSYSTPEGMAGTPRSDPPVLGRGRGEKPPAHPRGAPDA